MAIYGTTSSGVYAMTSSGVYQTGGQATTGTIIDGFEDNDLSEWGASGGDPSDFSLVTTTSGNVFDGTYALACPSGMTADIVSESGLPDYPAPGDSWHVRFYVPDASDGFAYFRYGYQDGSNYYYLMPRFGDNTWRIRKNNGSVHETLAQTSYTWQTDVWYHGMVDWATDGSMTARLYNAETGSLEAEISASDSEYGQGAVSILTYNVPSTWYVDLLTMND